MKKRWLFNVFSVVSLLVCLATIALWVRSNFVADRLEFSEVTVLYSFRGKLMWVSHDWPPAWPPPPSTPLRHFEGRPTGLLWTRFVIQLAESQRSTDLNGLGLHVWIGQSVVNVQMANAMISAKATGRAVIIADGWIVGLSLLLPLIWGLKYGVRSYWVADRFGCRVGGGNWDCETFSTRGVLAQYWTKPSDAFFHIHSYFRHSGPYTFRPATGRVDPGVRRHGTLLGFSWLVTDGGIISRSHTPKGQIMVTALVPARQYALPYWFVTLLFAILPAMWLVGWWRRRRRAPSACRKCGYDLRATPERCPECGTLAVKEPNA